MSNERFLPSTKKVSTNSRKQAIDEFCKWCIVDDLEPGTWRQQVQACECTDCPLYEFRPVPIEIQRSPRKVRNNRSEHIPPGSRVKLPTDSPGLH